MPDDGGINLWNIANNNVYYCISVGFYLKTEARIVRLVAPTCRVSSYMLGNTYLLTPLMQESYGWQASNS